MMKLLAAVLLLVIVLFCSTTQALNVNKDDELLFNEWLRERQLKAAIAKAEPSPKSAESRRLCLPYSTCSSEIDHTVSLIILLAAITCFFGYYQCYECQKNNRALNQMTSTAPPSTAYQRLHSSVPVTPVSPSTNAPTFTSSQNSASV